MKEYLESIEQREKEKNDEKQNEVRLQQAEIEKLRETEQDEEWKEIKIKRDKIETLKKYLDEVNAERKITDETEKEFINMDKHQTHFPYTHGDSLEMARERYRNEMN